MRLKEDGYSLQFKLKTKQTGAKITSNYQMVSFSTNRGHSL